MDIGNLSNPTGWGSIEDSPLGREGGMVRNQREGVRNICIPVAIYNVSAAATVPNSMREGPMTYREASALLGVFLQALKSHGAVEGCGGYILHHQDRCAGIRIEGSIAHVYDPRRRRSPIFNTLELIGLICNMERFVVFRLRGGSFATSVYSVSLGLLAPPLDDIIRPDAPVWNRDKYRPMREEGRSDVAFMGRLKIRTRICGKRFSARMSRIVSANRVECPISPFRIFDRMRRVLGHIRRQRSEMVDPPYKCGIKNSA